MSDTIEQSLESIIENLPKNFEIVIVDQSTDGSKKIIDQVASKSGLTFKRIYVDFPLGVGHSRNLAVCEATGNIVITHVDVDDWYNSSYFSALVELYLEIRSKRGSDFFFSCPNMNISSQELIMENYLLTSVPIGANEKEYVWRAIRNDDFVRLAVDDDVSGRIKLSDRKNLWSRIDRTYARHLGMYKIGYSTVQILKEDVIEADWSLHSCLFRTAILPFVMFHSMFVDTICHASTKEESLFKITDSRSYEIEEIKQKYDISRKLSIDDLITES
jgi:glycosyltransferase involved in cell wall biosynthesis